MTDLKQLIVSLGGAVGVLQIEPRDPDVEFLLLFAEVDGLQGSLGHDTRLFPARK